MSRFDSVEFGASDSKRCSECGMQKKDGCCHDDVSIVKLTTAHLGSVVPVPNFEIAILPPEFFAAPVHYSYEATIVVNHLANAPPGSLTPIYLKHGVFRI